MEKRRLELEAEKRNLLLIVCAGVVLLALVVIGAAGRLSFRTEDRGSGWDDDAGDCRSALRGLNDPGCRVRNLGFRLALVPVQ